MREYTSLITSLAAKEQWSEIVSYQTWWARKGEQEKEKGQEKKGEEKKGEVEDLPSLILLIHEGEDKEGKDDIIMGDKWLSLFLLRKTPFTHNAYDTYERLFGPSGPSDWGYMLSRMVPPVPLDTIRFLVEEKGVTINWNTSRASLPLLYHVAFYRGIHLEKGREYMTYLIHHGANPNATCHESQPLLTYFVSTEMYSFYRPQDHAEGLLRAELLLENGADPLLEDKEGRTVIDLVNDAEQFTTTPNEIRTEWLALLERYA